MALEWFPFQILVACSDGKKRSGFSDQSGLSTITVGGKFSLVLLVFDFRFQNFKAYFNGKKRSGSRNLLAKPADRTYLLPDPVFLLNRDVSLFRKSIPVYFLYTLKRKSTRGIRKMARGEIFITVRALVPALRRRLRCARSL